MNFLDKQAYFFKQIRTQHLSHAYLFLGANHFEKQRLSTSIIQALGCPSFNSEGQPCEDCEWCSRVANGQLPDIMYIEPDGKGVKVDQIRELKEWLNRSPVELKFKVGIIKQADTMTINAANALLTILEEPKSEIYLILHATTVDKLLPTIVSRVQQIHFDAFEADELIDQVSSEEYTSHQKKIFKHLPSQTIEDLLTLSLEQFEEWLKLTEQWYQVLYQKNPTTFALLQTRFKNILTSQQLDLAIDYLLVLNHQVITCILQKIDSEFHLVNQLVQNPRAIDDLLKMNDVFIEARQYLQANVTAQLVAEKIVLDLI